MIDPWESSHCLRCSFVHDAQQDCGNGNHGLGHSLAVDNGMRTWVTSICTWTMQTKVLTVQSDANNIDPGKLTKFGPDKESTSHVESIQQQQNFGSMYWRRGCNAPWHVSHAWLGVIHHDHARSLCIHVISHLSGSQLHAQDLQPDTNIKRKCLLSSTYGIVVWRLLHHTMIHATPVTRS